MTWQVTDLPIHRGIRSFATRDKIDRGFHFNRHSIIWIVIGTSAGPDHDYSTLKLVVHREAAARSAEKSYFLGHSRLASLSTGCSFVASCLVVDFAQSVPTNTITVIVAKERFK
jgi:hypothetical protein